MLVRVAGGYRFQSHPDLAPYVERFVLEGQIARLSAAALETLAIIAYKQPISRGPDRRRSAASTPTASCARSSCAATSTEVGRDPGPGQAVLWGTTPLFLEQLGLDSLDDLPPLGRLRAGRRGGRGAGDDVAPCGRPMSQRHQSDG